MRRFYIVLFSLLSIASCLSQKYNDGLLRIESYIQTDPVRALKELLSYSDSLSSVADKGLYSLLYSMALDKNYIDLKNDSIVRPAVTYFSKHKDNYRTFLSYYYLGRVYENAEDYSQALLAYIKAESYFNSSISGEYVTRLHSAKERLFFQQFAFDKALDEAYKAQKASSTLENSSFYIRSCLDIIGLLNSQNRLDEASSELDSLSRWIRRRGESFPSAYYNQVLYKHLYHSNNTLDSVCFYASLYENACIREDRKPDSILLSEVLLKKHEYERAKALFDHVSLRPSSSINDSITYYSVATRLYKGLRDFDNYVASVEESRRLIETKNLEIFRNDVRFLEERYNNSLEQERKKNRIILLSLLLGLMMVAIVAIVIYSNRRHRELKRSYEEIQGEYAIIQEALKNCGDESGDIKSQLNLRLQALAPYFQNVPSRQIDRKVLRNLTRDNHEMLRNIGLLYSLSFPKFVSGLVKSGLSAEEIGLCSLYASGFVTKELSDMIDSGSIYQINCSIREKLGNVLDGRTLPAWLRDSFKSCES